MSALPKLHPQKLLEISSFLNLGKKECLNVTSLLPPDDLDYPKRLNLSKEFKNIEDKLLDRKTSNTAELKSQESYQFEKRI